jgi:hypothetical protein
MNDSSNPPRVRALASSSGSADSGQQAKGFQRAAGALRMALPHLLRLLPLLDGNVGSAVSNLLNPPSPSPPPAPPVDLTPIEDGLAELQTVHRDLRGQVLEQNASLKRVEGRLQMVEEAAGRNTLVQQELLRELKAVGNRMEELKVAGRKANVFAQVALGLLGISILLNVALLLHFRHILP